MAFNTREENAADLAFEEAQRTLQGVCKDCGNGTLNNSIVRAFNCEEDGYICCARCGSEHLDIL